MADIVLSYARENREQAELLAGALENAGWSVWWDRAILPGVSYEKVIEAELSSARCVVALWSAAARESNWVRDEATLALSRNVLVSVLLDDSEPPLGFRQQQTAHLKNWDGSATDPAFAILTQGIAHVVGRAGSQTVAPTQRMHGGPTKRVKAGVITLVIVGCVLAVGGAVLWSPGYFWQDDATAPAVAPQSDAVPGLRDRDASPQALTVPAGAAITLPRQNVTLTILSGTLEPVNPDLRTLTLHIRFSNNGTSFYRTYYSNLRLIVADVPRAPNDPPLEQVEAASAREFDYRFDVPATVTSAVLRVTHDDQTRDIQLDLKPPRR